LRDPRQTNRGPPGVRRAARAHGAHVQGGRHPTLSLEFRALSAEPHVLPAELRHWSSRGRTSDARALAPGCATEFFYRGRSPGPAPQVLVPRVLSCTALLPCESSLSCTRSSWHCVALPMPS